DAVPPAAPAAREASGPRTTARSVLVADAAAGGVIRTGGLMVIVALLGILAYLLSTVAPLFRPARVESLPVAGVVPVEGVPFFTALDEYRRLAAAVGERPEVGVFRPDDPRE